MTMPHDEKPFTPAGDAPHDPPGSISAELQELGRQLASTARAAWRSEKRQEVQQEVVDGLRSLRDQVTEALDTVRADPRPRTVSRTVRDQVDKMAETVKSDRRAQSVTQAVKEQADKVAGTVRGLDPVDELRGGLASGLRELNEQLRRLADRLAERPATDVARPTEGSPAASSPGSVGTPLVTDVRDTVPVATPLTSATSTPTVDRLPRGPEGGTTP